MRKQRQQLKALADAQVETDARQQGPQQKKGWHLKDMKPYRPMTDRQREALAEFAQGQHVALLGSAGTGKTFLAMCMAYGEMLRQGSEIDKVVLIRSTAQSRDQGFLKGTQEDKEAPFMKVYKGKLAELFGRERTYDDMVVAGKTEFMSTSFQRGESWDNTIAVFDEAQNANWEEINTAITRLGKNSRIIIAGDTKQCDLSGHGLDISGLHVFEAIARHVPEFSIVNFTIDDVVRSPFVKSWLRAVERHVDTQAYAAPAPARFPHPPSAPYQDERGVRRA